MIETTTGHDRSNGPSYNDIISKDTVAPPAVYLEDSPLPAGRTTVATERYYSQEEHNREVEQLWKRVWQMACHESDIPNVGDSKAPLSYLRREIAVFTRFDAIEEIPLLAATTGIKMNFVRPNHRI